MKKKTKRDLAYKIQTHKIKLCAATQSGSATIDIRLDMLDLGPDEMQRSIEELASHIIAVIPNTPFLRANLTHIRVIKWPIS